MARPAPECHKGEGYATESVSAKAKEPEVIPPAPSYFRPCLCQVGMLQTQQTRFHLGLLLERDGLGTTPGFRSMRGRETKLKRHPPKPVGHFAGKACLTIFMSLNRPSYQGSATFSYLDCHSPTSLVVNFAVLFIGCYRPIRYALRLAFSLGESTLKRPDSSL